jgi:hypothetical protein
MKLGFSALNIFLDQQQSLYLVAQLFRAQERLYECIELGFRTQ